MKKAIKFDSLKDINALKDKFLTSKEKKMTDIPNIGWKFFKAYYDGLSLTSIDENYFNKKNADFLKTSFSQDERLLSSGCEHSFTLKTVYPGLLTGSGISHGTNLKGEIKLGFCFDYTTGLPYIPASSIKGTLRSVFPNSYSKGNEKYKQSRISYIRNILEFKKIEIDVNALEKEIFDGEGVKSIYERDIFFDAVITKVNSKDRQFLENDFITPHYKNVLQNPIPIMFLKILPNVEFTFRFKLNDGAKITAQDKLNLFKTILLDIGIGAKTNVGYGQFENVNLTSNSI
jgi:CRISPR-associated protein Cmr6